MSLILSVFFLIYWTALYNVTALNAANDTVGS